MNDRPAVGGRAVVVSVETTTLTQVLLWRSRGSGGQGRRCRERGDQIIVGSGNRVIRRTKNVPRTANGFDARFPEGPINLFPQITHVDIDDI